MSQVIRYPSAFVNCTALAAGTARTPAASALPLTGQSPRELDEINIPSVSRKALAAGSSVFHAGSSVTPYATPAASALPLTEARP